MLRGKPFASFSCKPAVDLNIRHKPQKISPVAIRTLYALVIQLIWSFAPYSIALFGFSYMKIQQANSLSAQEKKWLQFNALSLLAFRDVLICRVSDNSAHLTLAFKFTLSKKIGLFAVLNQFSLPFTSIIQNEKLNEAFWLIGVRLTPNR